MIEITRSDCEPVRCDECGIRFKVLYSLTSTVESSDGMSLVFCYNCIRKLPSLLKERLEKTVAELKQLNQSST